MTRDEQIKLIISERWKDDAAADICGIIIDYIVDNSPDRSKMMTYAMLARLTQVGIKDDRLIRAVSILSARFNALLMHFLFVDDEGNEFYLADDEARDFIEHDRAVHPLTGAIVDDVALYIYPFYEGNRAALLDPVNE